MIARKSVPSPRRLKSVAKSAKREINQEWIDLVLAERKKRSWGWRKFADEIRKHTGAPCSHQALHKLLIPDADGEAKQDTSGFIDAISSLFGIPLPNVTNPQLTQIPDPDEDPREAALLEAFRKMPPEEQEPFLALARVRSKST